MTNYPDGDVEFNRIHNDPKYNSSIHFQAGGADDVLVIDRDGMLYKGKRIEDAGEAYAAFMQMMGQMNNQPKIREAAKKLYYAAHWSADRDVEENKLWENLRDALGLEPGNSPEEIKNEN
jgi:hypothetical protein